MTAARVLATPPVRIGGPLAAGLGAVLALAWLERTRSAGTIELALLFVALSAAWLHREIRVLDLRRLTIAGVWWWTYLAMLLVPSLFVQAEHTGPGRDAFVVGVLSLLVTVPLGVWLANRVTGFRAAELARFDAREWDDAPAAGERAFRGCVAGLALALLLTLAYLAQVRTVPLFYLLAHPGESVTVVLLRESAFKLLASPLQPVYYLLRVLGFPLLVLTTLGWWLRLRTRRWLALFLVTLASALFFAALSIAKAPVAVIVLLVCLYLYAQYGRRIPARTLALGALSGVSLMIAFPLAVVLLVSAGTGVDAGIALLALGRRLFYLPSEVVYWYFTLFPGSMGALHGRTIGKLAWLLGWRHFDAPNYVGLCGLNTWIESVNANGAFIGTLHADFGLAGVLAGGVVAGALMQALQVRAVRGRRTVLTLATYVWLVFAFWLLHSTSLPIVLATNGVALVVAAPWLMRTFGPPAAALLERIAPWRRWA